MKNSPFIKQYLMTAGPTPLPPQVQEALAQPMLYHRAQPFRTVLARVLENLRYVFQTENDVLLFTASGTGAMESAVANLVAPGESVLACAGGKFGDRWINLCTAYQAKTVEYRYEWGERLDPQEVDRLLTENPNVEVVFATLSETSTGVVNDIQALAETTRHRGVILVVDAVSGLGATELQQDEWGIDVVVSGSQKALMTPPGLAFASVSQKALDFAKARTGSHFYFDWQKAIKGQRKEEPDTAFTPAVGLIQALDVALGMIKEEGLESTLNRHDVLAQATRAGAKALGLRLFGDPDELSTVVTAIELPSAIDGDRVPGELRKLGITANGGQDHLKGRIIRIAHCGYFGAFDTVVALSGLELVLSQLGYPVEFGTGVGAAQKVLMDATIATTTH